MKILGLDVSKGKVTGCVLESVPPDLKRYHQKTKCPVFAADIGGITDLLALEFDGVALEPSGIHYARIWVHHLAAAGKPIKWVGHKEIRHYREFHKLPNKSDNADAIAIAAYALERWDKPGAFVDGEAEELRYLYLQLQTLGRTRTALINRLKQQLCHEWPEVADKEIKRNWLAPSAGILAAIAGTEISKKWQKELDRSIGIGISPFSAGLASQLLSIESQELGIERQIADLMAGEKYTKYLAALDSYGIQGRTAAAVLATVYPVDRFLRDGKEFVERIDGKKYYRSLSSFKLSLGIGKVQYQSGGIEKWKAGGSSECRRALYLWVATNIVMHPDLSNEKIVKLHDYFKNGSTQTLKNGETVHFDPGKGNQRIMRVVRRLVERLFYDLISA